MKIERREREKKNGSQVVFLVLSNELTYKVTMLVRVLLVHRMLSELLSATALTSQWMAVWDNRHDRDENDHVSLRGP